MLWQMGGPAVSCTVVQRCKLGKGGDCPILLFFGMWPQFESCSQFWAPQYQKDLRLLESIWRRNTVSEGEAIWEIAEVTWLLQLEKRRPREGSSLSACSSWGAVSISVLCDHWQDPREQHGAVSGRFMLDFRKRFFPRRLIEHWNRLPREWSWP